MIDKSKQLAIRVDLYLGYILTTAIVVSICEIPLLVMWLVAAKYLLLIGWLVLLFLATARMWKVKTERDLTSELQLYKIFVGCIIIAVLSSICYSMAARMAPALTNQLAGTIQITIVLNLLAALDVYAIGVLGIYCFDKLQDATRGSSR